MPTQSEKQLIHPLDPPMKWKKIIPITTLWIAGAYFSVHFNPFALQLYFILSTFALIFTNLGERRSGLSAYSVFNKDCQYIEGDLRAEQLDNEFRHRPSYVLSYYHSQYLSIFLNLSSILLLTAHVFFLTMHSDYHVQRFNNDRQNSFNHSLNHTSDNHEDLLERTRREIMADGRRSHRSYVSNERPSRRR